MRLEGVCPIGNLPSWGGTYYIVFQPGVAVSTSSKQVSPNAGPAAHPAYPWQAQGWVADLTARMPWFWHIPIILLSYFYHLPLWRQQHLLSGPMPKDVLLGALLLPCIYIYTNIHTDAHTHINIYIYMYLSIYLYTVYTSNNLPVLPVIISFQSISIYHLPSPAAHLRLCALLCNICCKICKGSERLRLTAALVGEPWVRGGDVLPLWETRMV